MVIEPYSNEELWSPKPYQLPQRSHLNCLMPIAVGTPSIESLTSYITRLAQSHSITISTLMTRELAPILDKDYVQKNAKRGLSTLLNRGAAINSTGELAQLFADSIERLTLEKNLFALTLLSFRDCLSSKELLHKTKSWCSDCYEEWRSTDKTIYEPLLWSFRDVKVCAYHNRLLQTTCFNCDRHIPWLHSKSRIGYCPYCDRWLGSSNDIRKTHELLVLSKNELERNLWISNNIGELIACSEENSIIKQENIAKAIREIVNITHQGNIASFAKFLKLPKNTVWMWAKGKSLPKLKFILDICYCLDISPLSFLKLEPKAFESLQINSKRLLSVVNTKRISPRNFDAEKIEKDLKTIISSQNISPPTMKEVAKILGFDVRVISEHFPELCKAISDKHRRDRNRVQARKIEESCQEVRQAVSTLIQRGEYPSEARVSQLISQPGYFRYKKVRIALKQAISNLIF
ncbi:MAG: TniQ family protein [Cyanobacteria bacterium P01_A01_bin.83]